MSFGDSLIKHVVETLTAEFPRLRTFATLSPIPGFRAWLGKHAGAMLERLDDKRRTELGRAVGFEPVTAGHPSFWLRLDKAADLDARIARAPNAAGVRRTATWPVSCRTESPWTRWPASTWATARG